MQLGNPSNASANPTNHDHYLILRTVEAIDYSDNLGQPNWASWDLTSADIGLSGRTDAWAADTNLPPGFYQVPINAFSGTDFDRGHMCPSADRTDNTNDNALLFYMSNIIPQASLQNEGIWANFESYCRNSLLPGNRELLIICGPSSFTTNKVPSNSHVTIPAYTWKIVVVVPPGAGTATNRIGPTNQVIALRIPNIDSVGSDPWQNYRTNVVAIENDTGFSFFTALPPNLATVLRNKTDGQTPPPPTLTGFSPALGTTNSIVAISGTNFVFATNVTFNGISALFTIDSTTQITAMVPTNASSGPIAVATLNGTATSSSNFVVTGSVLDLAITVTHTGNFAQGDTADTYDIIVANVGGAASSGTVTVTDFLPAGLSATGIGGAGWTTNLGTLTCTRSDVLTNGAAYPPITVTVSVSPAAPSSVTNSVMVSGGGDSTPANNTANDPTTINASGAVSTTLVGWDVSTQTNYGVSPLAPTTNAPNLSIVGLGRGFGVATSGTAAARAWGGNGFTNATAAAAVAFNQFASFSVAANNGYKVSYSSLNKFDYRRSGTGAASGVLQYQIGSGAFADIAALSYPSNTSSGGSIGPIDLSVVSSLQNVGAGTNVTFRIVNYGGSNPAGNWYLFDVANSSAPDFAVAGSVSPALTPIESWRLQYFGTTADSGPSADTAISSNDGMPNLLKYALGLNPLIATNNPIVGDISTGFLRLTLPKNPNATDISFHVEVSPDVTGPWTSNGTVIDQNSSILLQVHDGTAVGDAPRGFIRLNVTRP